MSDFKYYINSDFFKIGRFGEKHVKRVNIGLLSTIYILKLVISFIILISAIFYVIIYSSSNFNALDELEDYIEVSRLD